MEMLSAGMIRKKKAVIWFWQINDYAKLMICYLKICIGLSRGIRNKKKKSDYML